MKRLALLIVSGAVWLFLAAIPVFADGGPHVLDLNNGSAGITADSCAGCHRMHTSTSPTGFLLTSSAPTITGYCRSCHGVGGLGAATDVDTGVQYSLNGVGDRTGPQIGALRSGGFIQARIGTADGSRNVTAEGMNAFIPVSGATAVTSAHLALGTVASGGNGLTATNILWGNGAQNSSVYGPTLGKSMECTSCHNPHGNGNYRILDTRPVLPAVAVTVPVQPAAVIGSLVPPSTRDAATNVPRNYIGPWTPVDGMKVKDSPYDPARQKNYTVIATAPIVNSTTYPIPAQPATTYLLYTDQLTGGNLSDPLTGDYLKKFLAYNAHEEPAVAGDTVANFYDGPNGYPNQGGWAAGSRVTDFPENVPGTGQAGRNYDGFGYQMTLWCTQCHTRYLGWTSSRSTDSTDDTFMFRHSTSKYRVCSTCHVSHGSNAIMSGTESAKVPFPNGAIHPTDSRLLKLDNRGICLDCHDPTGTAEGLGVQGTPVTTAPNPGP